MSIEKISTLHVAHGVLLHQCPVAASVPILFSISSRFHNTRLLPHLSDFTSDSQHWLLTRNGEAPAKLPRPCHCLVVGRQNVRAMENARVAACPRCRQVIIATALMILPSTKTMVPRFPSRVWWQSKLSSDAIELSHERRKPYCR